MKKEIDVLKIKAIMQHYGLNQTDFSAKTGIPKTSVSKILRGERTCGEGIANKILLAFDNINAAWLFENTGRMLSGGNSCQTFSGDINHNSHIGHGAIHCEGCGRELDTRSNELVYPIVPTEVIKAPDVNIAEWLEENLDQCKKIDLHKLIGKISHVQPMASRAMEPRIPEGALLFMREVNSWDEALLDGSVYGVDVNKPHMIVRKVYDEGEFIRCEPVNPEFGAVRVPKSKVMNLYKIRVGLKVFE